MGMSIDLHVYDYFELVKDIEDSVKEQRPDGQFPEGRTMDEFVEKILPAFGLRTGDKYATLWNEYYSDSGYNSASELFRAVELYFGVDDIFLSGYDYAPHANANEVLDELGIKPIGDDDDDE